MQTRKNIGIAALGIASGAHGQGAMQWRVADGGNGHWYALNARGGMTWSQLNQLTLANGGHLATMTGTLERDFLVTLMAGNSCAIGGFQTVTGAEAAPAIGWGWCTGEAMSWTNWAGGEPNNTDLYGATSEDVMGCRSDGLWVDLADHLIWTQSYLSEWDADCNNDGVVDYGQCRDGTLPDYNCNNIPDCCERGETCVVGSYPMQWRVADGGNGHWYEVYVFGHPTRWTDARASAQAMGGDLASLESAGEPGFALDISGNPDGWGSRVGPWLGGFQDTSAGDYAEPANGWRWTSGAPWTFAHWGPGEPNDSPAPENFLHLISNSCPGYPAGRFYNDVRGYVEDIGPCDKMPISAIIEWSADCNHDGIVDKGQILSGQLADANSNGIPDTCEGPTCRDADLFRNGVINGADLGILLSEWGPAYANTVSDINRDGVVNGADLGFLLANWGPCQN